DDWVIRWPALGFEDPRDCGRIERIRAEAVDGLSWKRDQPAATQYFGSTGDGRRAWLDKFSHYVWFATLRRSVRRDHASSKRREPLFVLPLKLLPLILLQDRLPQPG